MISRNQLDEANSSYLPDSNRIRSLAHRQLNSLILDYVDQYLTSIATPISNAYTIGAPGTVLSTDGRTLYVTELIGKYVHLPKFLDGSFCAVPFSPSDGSFDFSSLGRVYPGSILYITYNSQNWTPPDAGYVSRDSTFIAKNSPNTTTGDGTPGSPLQVQAGNTTTIPFLAGKLVHNPQYYNGGIEYIPYNPDTQTFDRTTSGGFIDGDKFTILYEEAV